MMASAWILGACSGEFILLGAAPQARPPLIFQTDGRSEKAPIIRFKSPVKVLSVKRKAISKRIRFDVFKRDSFTCQYCGKKAPDVVLEVDHITPVSVGGSSDILNLVTSCEDCNAGKSNKLLSDDSAVVRQHMQMGRVNEKRLQLEMVLQWRGELDKLEATTVNAICDRIAEKSKYRPNDIGIANIRKWLKRFQIIELLESLDISFDHYYKGDEESWQLAFTMVPRIAANQRKCAEDPTLKDLFYIRGILRNRIPGYFNECRCMELLKLARQYNCSIPSLYEVAKSVRNWTQFQNEIMTFVEGRDAS